jgi:hypothetical protein
MAVESEGAVENNGVVRTALMRAYYKHRQITGVFQFVVAPREARLEERRWDLDRS